MRKFSGNGNKARLTSVVCVLVLLFSVAAPATAQRGRDKWQQPERVMEDLNLEPGDKVADVGCGRGYFTFRLARAVGKKGQVVAVDINERSVRSVRQRAEREDLKQVEAHESAPADAKLPAGQMDAALLCLVLHHASDDVRQPLVKSIARGLKPGGYLFVLDFRKVKNPRFHSYEQLVAREKVIQFAKEAGLSLDAEYLYLKEEYFLRFRKPEKEE